MGVIFSATVGQGAENPRLNPLISAVAGLSGGRIWRSRLSPRLGRDERTKATVTPNIDGRMGFIHVCVPSQPTPPPNHPETVPWRVVGRGSRAARPTDDGRMGFIQVFRQGPGGTGVQNHKRPACASSIQFFTNQRATPNAASPQSKQYHNQSAPSSCHYLDALRFFAARLNNSRPTGFHRSKDQPIWLG